MNTVNIKVQVHCLQPYWVATEKNIYRLYINNDLLTERSWIWDTNTVINEDIWVNLSTNTTNLIKIEPILNPVRSTAKFIMKNLQINGNLCANESEEQSELSFRI